MLTPKPAFPESHRYNCVSGGEFSYRAAPRIASGLQKALNETTLVASAWDFRFWDPETVEQGGRTGTGMVLVKVVCVARCEWCTFWVRGLLGMRLTSVRLIHRGGSSSVPKAIMVLCLSAILYTVC